MISVNSISEVITRLTDVTSELRERKSRLGFSPALYRQVTIKVMEGIHTARFEDSQRMESLDVIFANRCLNALEQHKEVAQPSRCWTVAFNAVDKWRPLVLQHFLLGMNAHINLDLGVAAAQTAPGDKLAELKRDFEVINDILAELPDVVQNKLGAISPLLNLLDDVGGKSDEAVFNFSLRAARSAVWSVAELLAPLDPGKQAREIEKIDRGIEKLAGIILRPDRLLNAATLPIRLAERRNTRLIIDDLT